MCVYVCACVCACVHVCWSVGMENEVVVDDGHVLLATQPEHAMSHSFAGHRERPVFDWQGTSLAHSFTIQRVLNPCRPDCTRLHEC